MAITDVSSGIIIGCNPGTLTYLHEEGHISFAKSELGIKIQFYCTSSLIITVGILVLLLFTSNILIKIWAASSFATFLLLYFYEEFWCWRHAYKNINLKKKKPQIKAKTIVSF